MLALCGYRNLIRLGPRRRRMPRITQRALRPSPEMYQAGPCRLCPVGTASSWVLPGQAAVCCHVASPRAKETLVVRALSPPIPALSTRPGLSLAGVAECLGLLTDLACTWIGKGFSVI